MLKLIVVLTSIKIFKITNLFLSAVGLANGMQVYRDEDLLTGSHLMFDCDIKSSMDLLQFLNPENCLVSVSHKSFAANPANKKEKWYGTQFCERKFTDAEMTRWNTALSSPLAVEWEGLISLPQPNPFIPTDFALKELPTAAAVSDRTPILIDNRITVARVVESVVVNDKEDEKEETHATGNADADAGDDVVADEGEEEDGEEQEDEDEVKEGEEKSTSVMPTMPGKTFARDHFTFNHNLSTISHSSPRQADSDVALAGFAMEGAETERVPHAGERLRGGDSAVRGSDRRVRRVSEGVPQRVQLLR